MIFVEQIDRTDSIMKNAFVKGYLRNQIITKFPHIISQRNALLAPLINAFTLFRQCRGWLDDFILQAPLSPRLIHKTCGIALLDPHGI